MSKFRVFAAIFGVLATAFLAFGINYISNAQSLKQDKQDESLKFKQPVVSKSERFCGTDHNPQKIAEAEADFAIRSEELRDAPSASGGVINVYFHVVYSGTRGNISDAMIAEQMRVLNNAYAGWGY